MSRPADGYHFPSATGGSGLAAPSSSSPPVLCPGEGTRRPSLDSRLATPETREEVIGGVRVQTMAADPPHGDSHFDFSVVLGALLRPGYVGSIDMLTRYGQGDDFAADIAVRQGGIDPQTGERHLQELVFEIGNTQRLKDLGSKAERMSARGVRRIFAILVQEGRAYEWNQQERQLQPMGDIALYDPQTLVRALPLSLMLLIARGAAGKVPSSEVQQAVNNFTAEALLVQGNPVLQRAKHESEEQGRLQGHKEGHVQMLRVAIGDMCQLLGIELTTERQAYIAGLDGDALDALRQRLLKDRSFADAKTTR